MQQVPAMQATLNGLMMQVDDVSQRASLLSNQMVEWLALRHRGAWWVREVP